MLSSASFPLLPVPVRQPWKWENADGTCVWVPGLEYIGTQGRCFDYIWSLHPWRTNVPLWQLWSLKIN